ncbi:MAG: ATP-binding protein [Bacteroidales bacterium]|nr:ATP-binding protein [Bacteroidales bacterium]
MTFNYKQIVTEQREEIPLYLQRARVPREQEGLVNIHSDLAQIITGVRRSGKSTLAHKVLKEVRYAYVNFDDERLATVEPGDMDLLLEALYAVYGTFTHLLLYEIQNVENWSFFVNRLLRNNIRVVLTGSNAKLLSREMAAHLTGRYSATELFPFSFREFLSAKDIRWEKTGTAKARGMLHHYYLKYAEQGGFPEILAGEERRSYITQLFDAIVLRDIVYRYDLRHLRTFREMALYLTSNYASEISYNRLKNIFGLGSENTAKNYLSYLEEAWLILTLAKFSYKKQESLRYRKVYIIDTAFAQVSGEPFTPNDGRLLENVVFLHLIRHAVRQRYEVFYYKKQVEVDFVVYRHRQVQELIQVTQTLADPATLKREIRALSVANKELHAGRLTIITLDEEDLLYTGEGIPIHVIPIAEWLLKEE